MFCGYVLCALCSVLCAPCCVSGPTSRRAHADFVRGHEWLCSYLRTASSQWLAGVLLQEVVQVLGRRPTVAGAAAQRASIRFLSWQPLAYVQLLDPGMTADDLGVPLMVSVSGASCLRLVVPPVPAGVTLSFNKPLPEVSSASPAPHDGVMCPMSCASYTVAGVS